MEMSKIPSALKTTGNMSENWRKFNNAVKIYMKASGLDKKAPDVKAAILLNIIGEEAIDIFETLDLTEAEKENFDDCIKAFEKYCTPKKNILFERHQFYNKKQDDGEKFDAFLTEVRRLAKSCEFNNHEETAIRDKIVFGIHDLTVQETLIKLGDPELEKTAEICRIAEINKDQVKQIQQDQNEVKFDLECGQSSKLFDECFKDMSPSETAFMVNVRIPLSMNEINSRCSIFQRGMQCVENYITKCIDPNQRKIINNEIYGAKQFFKILCKDKGFQTDYLRHKECFYFIQNDWDICANEFKNVLKDEMSKIRNEVNTSPNSNSNLHFIQICCAKYGYENCVYNSAKNKCRKDSATFVHKIAKILSSEKQFANCDKIEKNICSKSSINKFHINYILILIIYYFNQL